MRKCVLFLIFGLMVNVTLAQSYKLHSVYIYGFTRYVIWPDEYNQGDFEIIILGDSPIIEELKILSEAKKVGDRGIKITKITSPSEIRKCNMLFISANQSAHLNDVIAKIANHPTLIISEEPGLGTKGSHINFIMKEGKLAFELNQSAASKNNLKVSNALTSMAILI